jgi:hypothetical protein
MPLNMPKYSDVRKAIFQSGIWVFQYTIRGSQMLKMVTYKFGSKQYGIVYVIILPIAKRGAKQIGLFLIVVFLQGDSEKKKYQLTRWNIVCSSKDQGGLRVQNLLVKNSTFLGKWLFMLLTENGVS